MQKTYEINLVSEHKKDLEDFLLAMGINHFVSASSDDLDVSEGMGDDTIEAMLSQQESALPLTLYFSELSEVTSFEERLKAFPYPFSVTKRTYPSHLWQQAWEPEEESYSCPPFYVEMNPDESSQPSDERILMTSYGAFGSGQHATTKAILSLLIQVSQDLGRESLLDVGTGTGILTIAAKRLGYRTVVATDIDEKAILSAQRNIEQNQVEVTLLFESLPENDGRQFDCIVCNILPPVLDHLLPELKARLRPGGRLLVAGISEANRGQTLSVAEQNGFSVDREQNVRAWVAVSLAIS